MKLGMGSYDRFVKSYLTSLLKQAGKEQYPIPYFISPRIRQCAGRGYGEFGAVAAFATASARSGAELLPVAAGEFDHLHVLHRQNPLGKIIIRVKMWCRAETGNVAFVLPRCCVITIRAKLAADSPALVLRGKAFDGRSPRVFGVPAPTIKEMREARRQNCTRARR